MINFLKNITFLTADLLTPNSLKELIDKWASSPASKECSIGIIGFLIIILFFYIIWLFYKTIFCLFLVNIPDGTPYKNINHIKLLGLFYMIRIPVVWYITSLICYCSIICDWRIF